METMFYDSFLNDIFAAQAQAKAKAESWMDEMEKAVDKIIKAKNEKSQVVLTA